jgi:hypothetical protein
MIEIGQLVAINPRWQRKGRKQAIQAWRHKDPACNYFSHHEPKGSEDYEQWFNILSESTGYVVKIDNDWIKVRFFCFDHELWFRGEYLCAQNSKNKLQ